MTDQYQDSAEEEFAPQDDQNVSMQEQPEQSSEADRRQAEQDRNWQAMRQRQKEMEIALQQKDEMLNRLLQNHQPQKAVQEVVEEEEPDEEYVPAGKVKGIARRTVQPLEKKIQELEARLAQQDEQKRISSFKSKYSDFDDVVNVETLELLEKQEPEIAATIASLKDPYQMGLTSYKYIKALGLESKLSTARRAKEIDQKIERNSKTVQSPIAYDKRPIAQAYKSTQADSTKLYEEMMFYASQASGL